MEGGSFARCVRHPSQFFTGFCSFCLVERLSNVDSVKKTPDPEPSSSINRGEIMEISSTSSVFDSERKGTEGRERRTLLSLFQLDDCDDARIECQSKPSTSNAAGSDKKLDPLENGRMKEKCSSLFPPKGLRWRLSGASKSGRHADSCDWRVCRESHGSHDSSDGTFEKHRHSWDGSVMSKALTCSFACLEEQRDVSSRIKSKVDDEIVVTNSDRYSGAVDASKTNSVSSTDEKPSSPNCTFGELIRERQHVESHQEINAMEISRKKSHRWSRVWDWSITSPFRDFGKKREHTLDRSLSESWQESRKTNIEQMNGSLSVVETSKNGLSNSRTNQCLNRNINGFNGEIQKYRPDCQRKREYRFGRSRSVHYPPPGNMDNGLLRFYLTPMRTSRRSSNRGRMRTSQFFAKGILGR